MFRLELGLQRLGLAAATNKAQSPAASELAVRALDFWVFGLTARPESVEAHDYDAVVDDLGTETSEPGPHAQPFGPQATPPKEPPPRCNLAPQD